MSKKTKAIIITRTSAYIDCNKVKEGREEFGKAIKKENEGRTSFSEGKFSLKKFLTANLLIKDWDIDNPKFGIRVPGNIRYKPELKKKFLYEQLLNVVDLLDDELKTSKCYVSFHPESENQKPSKEEKETEVVLILWDKLKRDSGEKVDDIEMFIKSIIDDCEIKVCNDDIENVLYIHDKQVFSNVNDFKDAVIWDESGLKESGFKAVYDLFKNYFVYVASFGHAAGGLTFNDRILKFKFGKPTAADKIGVIESEAISFLDLRDQAVKILEEENQKNS